MQPTSMKLLPCANSLRIQLTACALVSKNRPRPSTLSAQGQGCNVAAPVIRRPLSALAMEVSRPGGVPYCFSALSTAAEHSSLCCSSNDNGTGCCAALLGRDDSAAANPKAISNRRFIAAEYA